MVYRPVLISDNRALSQGEIEQAKALCKEVAKLVYSREAYVDEHGCDRDFSLPDANWSLDSSNDFGRAFLATAEGDATIIANLRLFVQVFTGFNMLFLRRGTGLRSINPIPENLDALNLERLEEYKVSWPTQWQNLTAGVPSRAIFSPPRMLGEVGFDINGVVVNHDTLAYQERITLLHYAGVLDWLDKRLEKNGKLRILEIGGGYGALAYWFKTAFPSASYTIVDLPESLIFSSLYLSMVRPDIKTGLGLDEVPFGVRFTPNYMAEQLDEPFDLVINTLSMSEMSAHQITMYAELMKTRWLADGGYFFEQNQDNTHIGLLCAKDVLIKLFPFGRRINSDTTFKAQGFANLWSLTDDFPETRCRPSDAPAIPHPIPTQLVEVVDSYNIVLSSKGVWALHKSLGPTDPNELETSDCPPNIYFGQDKDLLISRLKGING